MTILTEALRKRADGPAVEATARPAPAATAARATSGPVRWDAVAVGLGVVVLAATGIAAAAILPRLFAARPPAAPPAAPPEGPAPAAVAEAPPTVAYAPAEAAPAPPAEPVTEAAAEAPPPPRPAVAEVPERRPRVIESPFAGRPADEAAPIEAGARVIESPFVRRPAAPAAEDRILTITPLEGGLATAYGPIEVRDGGRWRRVQAGERLAVGAEIRAAPGASATIDLPGATLDLAGGAHLRLARLQRSGDRTEVGVHLAGGAATLRVAEGASASFSTPGLLAQAPAGRYRLEASAEAETVRVEAGALDLHSTAGGRLSLAPGQAARLAGGRLEPSP